MMFELIFLILISLVGAFFDVKERKIPNWLTFGTLLLVLVFYIFTIQFNLVLRALLGFVVGIALLFIPYLLGAMGAGDVKLLGALGSIVGFKHIILIFFYSTLSGLFLGIIWIILRPGHFKFLITTAQVLPPVDKLQKFPYGVAIFLGTILYIIVKTTGITKNFLPYLLWQ